MLSFSSLATLVLVSSAAAHPFAGQQRPAVVKRAENSSAAALSSSSTTSIARSSSTTTLPPQTTSRAASTTSIVVAAAVETTSVATTSSARPTTSSSARNTASLSPASSAAAAPAPGTVFQTNVVTVTVPASTVTVTVQAATVTSTVTQTLASQTVTSVRTLYVPTTTGPPLPLPTPVNFTDYTYDNVSFGQQNITQFLGVNNGIASWFRTNNSADSTNGMSWCQVRYNDSMPGFAPSVDRMLDNFGGNYEAAAEAYCGLEAVFTTPSGRNATFYIIDGFADPWVLTPGSIDVITGVYPLLYGNQTAEKNNVVQGVQWQFTGRRAEQFKFKGTGR